MRKFFLGVIVFLFGGLALLMPTLWTIRLTVMDRDVTSGWLRDSKVYDNLVGAVADLAKDQLGKDRGDGPPFDIGALTRAAEKALPTETVQKNIEAVLDGSYDWLEGKTEGLKFNLDLSVVKAQFIEAAGSESLARVANLPPCTEGASPQDFDPLSASCVPAGVDVQAVINQKVAELANSPDFIPDTSIKASDIKLGDNQLPIDQAASNAPLLYKLASWAPTILTALAALEILLIVLLSRPKRNGVKTVAWTIATVGILTLITGVVSNFLGGRIADGKAPVLNGSGIAEKLVLPLAEQINNSFSRWSIIFGAGYIVAAAVLAVGLILTRKKPEMAAKTETSPTPPIDDSPKLDAPKTRTQPAPPVGGSSKKTDKNR